MLREVVSRLDLPRNHQTMSFLSLLFRLLP